MPRSYPPEFRRKVLDLLKTGRRVGDVASDLGISSQTIYIWRAQERIDLGLAAGMTSSESADLAAARRRIAALETELAATKRANELLRQAMSQKAVRSDRGDGGRGFPESGQLSCRRRLRVWLLRMAQSTVVRTGRSTRMAHRCHPRRSHDLSRHLRRTSRARGAHHRTRDRRRSQCCRDAHATRWPARAHR